MNAEPFKSLSRTITSMLKRQKREPQMPSWISSQDKIREGHIPLDEKENYKPLTLPMALETSQKAKEFINALHHGDHIDDMTKKIGYPWRPNPVGRPIISGCEGPTERISSFVDHLLHHIAKIQKSYLKDTTDF